MIVRHHAAEIRKGHADHFVALVDQAQAQLHRIAVAGFFFFEVPFADVVAALAPAKADRPVGQHRLAGFIEGDGLPFGVVALAELAVEIARAHEAVGHEHGLAIDDLFHQPHQHRHVGKFAAIVFEVSALLRAQMEFLEHHMAERHRQRRVGALLRMQPQIGQLRDFGVIGRDRDRLGAFVADLGEEMRIRCTRLRYVAAPGDDEGGVVPIGRFGHVGLFAPDHRRSGRQIAIPVVKAHADAADQGQVARARRIRHHRHRGNRRKADDAIGAMVLDGMDVGRRDEFIDLVPIGADETAVAAQGFVFGGLGRIVDDAFPSLDRRQGLARFAPKLHEAPAHHRIFDPVGRIQIPAIARAARTTARLVVGHVGPGARVIGLLGFPGDDAAFHINLPRT